MSQEGENRMGEIIDMNNKRNENNKNDIVTSVEELLIEAREKEIPNGNSMLLPFAELATLGAGVASLLPAFNKITETTMTNAEGLYRIANPIKDYALQAAKDGTYWPSLRNGSSKKMAKLAEVDSISTTNTMVAAANPATMMMAVALLSIEKELGNIAEMEKQIISFLEIEKEAEIESEIISLGKIISNYKHNWDNELYVSGNYVIVCDIKKTAQKNMLSYQKRVTELLKKKNLLIGGSKVNATLRDLQKKLKYYRLALYTYSLAVLIEVMLSGNFKEANINASIGEIRDASNEYRNLFSECSSKAEELSKKAIEAKVLKGVGIAGGAIGKAIGSIPIVEKGPVDEFLIDKGNKIKENVEEISADIVSAFAEISNPNTSGLINKLEDMNRIYNHTAEICFDSKNLYLVTESA